MTISRGQMNRQLYMGGGIMNAMPRKQFGIGSFVKKAVKKVTGAVKDVASSDIGKAALLAGAGMYAGGIGPFASGRFGAGFASNLLPSSIGSTVTNMFSKKGVQGALVKGGALAGLTGFLTSQYGIPETEVESVLSDPSEKEKYLRLYYTNLNPVTADTNAEQYQQEVDEFVRTNSAMGGRIGYALGSMTGINTDKIKEDASGILDILRMNTPFGVAKMMVEKTQGNEAQIRNFIKKLLKSTPPGQVINFITDRYKIPESIASRMVVNQMADANMPTDASGSTDEGFPSRPEFESSAEDTSVIPIKSRRDEFDKRLEMEIKDRFERRPIQPLDRFEGGEPIQPLDRFEGGEPIQPFNRFTQEEIEDMLDRLRKMDPSDMPSIPLPEGRFEDDGLYDNEKKYYPNTYDPEPRYLNQGGRIGYALGGNELPPDPTTPVNPFKPKPIGPVLPNKAENVLSFEEFLEGKQEFMKQDNLEKLIEDYKRYLRNLQMNQARDMVAGGGIMNRAGYALGDTASQNAMQAAGIEGLPIRENPKGVKELDLRDNGGFIPPVGIKEKEDDIPAMLSNNEFVFTADAVRGMGDGDIELGAQRMYDQMKMLEEGGRV